MSGQITHRTDGNKEEKRIWKKGRGKTLEDMGSGVVRTSRTGKGGLGVGDGGEEIGGQG